jgi:ABC-type amino acid transport substrate-binding protein
MGSQAEKKETLYERVKRTKELRCSYVVYPPTFAKNMETGEFSGVMYDLMEALGKQMGIKIIWAEEVGMDGAFTGLATGRYDAVCPGFWINPERAAISNFAVPFYYQGAFAQVRADDMRFDAGPQTIDQAGVRIGVTEGEMAQLIAKENFPSAKIVSQPGLAGESAALMDVMTGKADVALILARSSSPSQTRYVLQAVPLGFLRVNSI